MIFLKLLLSSSLIFIVATSLATDEYSSELFDYAIPTHYSINLVPYIEAKMFYGECNISIHILSETKHIYLNSEDLCIIDVTLIANFKKYENDRENVYKPIYNTTRHIFNMYFMDDLSRGNYSLNIKYIGTAADNGGFRILKINSNEVWVAATHFQTTGARQLFPCWDQLNLEATFSISIKHYYQYTVLSNMPVRNIEILEEYIKLTHFVTTPVISTYLVTIIISNNLLCLSSDIGIISNWCITNSTIPANNLLALNVTENTMLFLNNIQPNRLKNIFFEKRKIDQVVVSNIRDEGMVNLGVIFYREADIIYDEMLDYVTRKTDVIQFVGRKVIQGWFYKIINPFLSDFWLNKHLATFLGTYTINKVFPNYRIMNLFVVQIQHNSLHLDADDNMWPFKSMVNSSFEIPCSIKALVILRMIQHAVTEKIFWESIYSYADNPYVQNGFGHFILEAIIKENKPNMLTVANAIKFWQLNSRKNYYPVIKIIRDYNNSTGPTNISIYNFNVSRNYFLPITFTTQTNPDFDNTSTYTWITQLPFHSVQLLSYKENGWMIFNVQQSGYYRVSYDDENWRRISNYLNCDDYKKIHVLNRAQIIDDAFHLMIAHQLNSSIFWNLTSYLHREEDYIAWHPMFKALEYMFSTFPVSGEKIGSFTTRIRHNLETVLSRIKYEEIDDRDEHTIYLRQEATKWACFFGDFNCKQKAENKLKEHLRYPETHSLLPWWKKWTYCNGLMAVTEANSTWQLVYNIELKRSDTKLLEFLACPESSSVIMHYLNLIKDEKKEIAKPEYLVKLTYSFMYIITKHANNHIILEYILKHFDEIKSNQISMAAAFTIIINNIYSVDQPDPRYQIINQYVENEYVKELNKTKIVRKRIFI